MALSESDLEINILANMVKEYNGTEFVITAYTKHLAHAIAQAVVAEVKKGVVTCDGKKGTMI